MASVQQTSKPVPQMRAGVRRPGEPLHPKPAPKVPPRSIPAPRSDAVKEETTHLAEEDEALSSRWERIDLPSRFAFYDWDEISVRPFDVFDQAKLARACRYRNVSLLLDVLSATCTRDARDLVYGDYQALCLWHKNNSYLNSPYTVTWQSRYGMRGSASVKKTRISETKLEKSRAEYLEWVKRGYAMNTCRDMELVTAIDDEDTLYLFNRAQFLDTKPLTQEIELLRSQGDRAPTLTARINELNRRGIKKAFTESEEFENTFGEFGVQEYADVSVGADFDFDKALDALRDAGDAEADAVAAAKLSGQPYTPRTEEVPLVFNPWGMFPYT